MKLTVLGSGITTNAPGSPYRFPAAHLIEDGHEKILFDASIAVLPQLAKLHVNLSDIKAICITHYHADHFALEPILQTYYLLAKAQGPQNLHIYGPSDIEEKVRQGCRTKGWTFDNDIAPTVGLAFHPYSDNQVYTLGDGLTLSAYQTKHYRLEAYALRLQKENTILAYSGDTAPSAPLQQAVANAKVFLCESALNLGMKSDEGHISVGDAAKIAAAQRVQHLVFTHYSGKDSPEDMIQTAKDAGFNGAVTVASDLESLDL